LFYSGPHHRSLTVVYRCFHHSSEGPRLPLPRSYLASFPLFLHTPPGFVYPPLV
jgi:hypothetical protein